LPQYAAAGLPRAVRLTGPGRLVDEPMLSATGRAARGAISSLYWAPGLEHAENQRFLDAYRARFGVGPDVAALGGYDTARVVAEALQRTNGEIGSAARLAEAVAGVEFTSPRGPFRFDSVTQAAVHDIYVREVKDERGTLRNVVLDRFPSVPTAPESDA
jgi:branched-chain amino acid transport system substrate-binding protein